MDDKAKGKGLAEELLAAMLPVARTMLSQYGEFYPYGGFMRENGAIVHVSVAIPGEEFPASRDLLNMLIENFRERARSGEIVASAIVYDTLMKSPTTGEKKDAIRCKLDCADGYSVEVSIPYHLNDGCLVEDEILAHSGNHEIFGRQGGPRPHRSAKEGP